MDQLYVKTFETLILILERLIPIPNLFLLEASLQRKLYLTFIEILNPFFISQNSSLKPNLLIKFANLF